jgi:hypothetical protein
MLVQFMVSSTRHVPIVSSGLRIVEHMETSANPAMVCSCLVGVELLALPLSTL